MFISALKPTQAFSDSKNFLIGHNYSLVGGFFTADGVYFSMNLLWLLVFEWRLLVCNQNLKYIKVNRLSRDREKCDFSVCVGVFSKLEL